MDVQEKRAPVTLDLPRFARAKTFAQRFIKRVLQSLSLANQPSAPSLQIGHDDRGPPRAAFLVQAKEQRAFHDQANGST
ncbi:hypothetical protein GCM10016234_07110 [Tianweitania populi]|uniref:Uncharacterized protein n=1 Tax=Tianweitania populi TaxID=1607949 RepID=A0A8J3DT95_9HYPH|nr:hypothetical protein GCM10016234_07110 [Tianweitania populi]